MNQKPNEVPQLNSLTKYDENDLDNFFEADKFDLNSPIIDENVHKNSEEFIDALNDN